MEGDFFGVCEVFATLGVLSYSPQMFILKLMLDK